MIRSRLLPAFVLMLSSFPAVSQRPPRAQTPSSAVISPDGALVAWTLRAGGGDGTRGSGATTLHLTAVSDPDPAKEKLLSPSSETSCSNNNPIWSPDSKWLAYTSTCTAKTEKPGQEQIFLWSRATGETKQLTHITGNMKQPAWSPDGKTIAFLFVENATRSAGALDAMKPAVGVIGKDNVEIQGVYGVDVESGKGSWLVPATPQMYAYEFAWAPNAHEVAYIGAPAPGENNWWVAKLYVGKLEGHSETQNEMGMKAGHRSEPSDIYSLRPIFDPTTTKTAMHGLQIAVPRYSPDGKRIAFIGGLMSDFSSNGGDVWVVNADGQGEPVDITPGIDGTPTWEVWLDDKTVGFVEDRRGHILLTDADANAHHVIAESSDDLGPVSVGGGGGGLKNAISGSNTGLIAYVQSSFTQAPEVFVGPPGKAKQFTHLNDGLKPASRTESVEWENEGFHVQGWLTFPKNYDEHRKYPLIVTVHGGPSSSVGAHWSAMASWADEGYFEFQPNPRGSFGQGEKFTAANIKDFGYGDLRDILKGLDRIEAKYPIDKHREGLTGWSYGGFMSMFAATQTGRFRAIVAGAGISDWLSYYGENSIDQWMIPFFGASVYDDPAVYAKSSAITFIKKAAEYKTPMLIIVGDRDGECPAPQSFEMWHALRSLGVKTELVVYPDEGHGFTNPEHIRDRRERTVRWFAENLK